MGRSTVLPTDSWPINLKITVEQRDWLRERAKIEDRSTSSLIRRLITEERDRLAATNNSAALAQLVTDNIRKRGSEQAND